MSARRCVPWWFPLAKPQSQAAQAHHNIAVNNDYLEQKDIAAAEYRAAIDLRRQLCAADPSVPRFTAAVALVAEVVLEWFNSHVKINK